MRSQDWELIRECPVPLLLASERPWSDERRLLVAVDPVHERDKPAELDAALLAAAGNLDAQLFGTLHVAHVFDPEAVPPRFRDAVRDHHRQRLRELVEPLGLPEEAVHYREDHVPTGLMKLTEELGIDLLVTGAVKRGRLERILVGATAERVLDLVACDVLTVKPGQAANG